jgi:heterodisulfide reductase subunit C2
MITTNTNSLKNEEEITIQCHFLSHMKLGSDFNANACINCGTCTAICPMEINLLPRQLFRYVLIGAEQKVLESTATIYSCLLCRMCEENCPAGVHIAENVRSLRTYLNREVYGLSRS